MFNERYFGNIIEINQNANRTVVAMTMLAAGVGGNLYCMRKLIKNEFNGEDMKIALYSSSLIAYGGLIVLSESLESIQEMIQ